MTKRGLRDLLRILVDGQVAPRVHDEGDVRCLRFNSGVVQSAMRIAEPYALELNYTRAMMGFLLFNADPQHIVVVGLGGGSLPKYCCRELPHTRITTVEIDPAVIALRDEFQVPADDERFRVLQADGGDYLGRDDVRADVIMLDGYDIDGLPDGLCSESFYARCRQVLSADGVLVANLWGGAPNRVVYLERLRSIFRGQVWWSRPADSSSLIVYALKDERYHPHWARLMSKAHVLDARYRLGLAQVVGDMRARPDPEP